MMTEPETHLRAALEKIAHISRASRAAPTDAALRNDTLQAVVAAMADMCRALAAIDTRARLREGSAEATGPQMGPAGEDVVAATLLWCEEIFRNMLAHEPTAQALAGMERGGSSLMAIIQDGFDRTQSALRSLGHQR